ncbi:MAG: hypothetical protein FJ098_12405, partial [Deltaproteobacteria bacterium]|nr:hypothetical protein [Deltaproteobacteria bacterium]
MTPTHQTLPPHSHSAAMELVRRRLAPGGLDRIEAAQLRKHLRICNECRRYNDRRIQVIRTAAGVPEGETAGIESLALFEETLARAGIALPAPDARSVPAWLRPLEWGLGLAAAALVALLVLTPQGGKPPQGGRGDPGTEELRSRGGPGDGSLPAAGLGLSGIDPEGAEYEVVESEGACIQDRLRFYVTSREEGLEWYFLFGVPEAGAPVWYFPSPEEARSHGLEPGPSGERVARPVPWEIELAGRHRPGRLAVVGLFSRVPLLYPDVASWVGEVLGRHEDGTTADWKEEAAKRFGPDVVPVLVALSVLDCEG